MVSPLNEGVEKSFNLYDEEFKFIKDYYIKYREVAPVSVFTDKFPGFEVYDTDGHIDHYVKELHKWKARHTLTELITNGAETLKNVGPYHTIQQMAAELAVLGRDTRQVRDLDLVANSQERLDSLKERLDLRASGKSILGVPTGVNAIDEAFGGWQKGDFIVVAGWTGSLKSWLALYFAQHAWKEGYRVLYISLEMSGEQIGYRFDTLLAGGAGEQGITNSALTHAEGITYDKYKNWLGEIMRDKHPFVVVTNEDLDEVDQNTVQAKIEQWKPDVTILDYHGLFDDASGAMGETEKTKNLSKAFKRLAIKTGCPIIDITGVTMNGDHGDRPPQLNEMAWSKQLAYDADLALSVCRHEEGNNNTLEVVSTKTRRGRDFKFYLDWDVDKGIVKERQKRFVFNPNQEDQEDDEQDEDQ